jgi:transglutaminase-like putative cysteine protease
MRYRLRHTTLYSYESTVSHSRHVIRKRPRHLPTQHMLRASLQTEPRPTWSLAARDYFLNDIDTVEVGDPHDQFSVTALSEVEVLPAPIELSSSGLVVPWEEVAARLPQDPDCYRSREMIYDSPLVERSPELLKLGQQVFTPGRPLFDAVQALNHLIHTTFTYDSSTTDVATPLEQVLEQKSGVCQDFAHVAIGVLRSLGLAARYVSGYLETMPPPGKQRLIGADASHAWAALFVPGEGWIGFDPTNDSLPRDQHIVVAWGRDFSDVSPLRGVVLGGGRHTVMVGVDVERISETPEPSSSFASEPPTLTTPPTPEVGEGGSPRDRSS